ncbi:PPP5C [Symbiodinium sp. CCMP2456]|nr:PPP5C [Symbiodinium sp. CCMP2456]
MASEAEEFKKRGNDHFKRQEFELAVEAYTRAIAVDPEECSYWLNRSNAYIQQGCWEVAELDAKRALQLDPANAKAMYRRAICLRKLGRLHDALGVLEDNANSENKAFQQLRNEVVHEIARQEARPQSSPRSRSSSSSVSSAEGGWAAPRRKPARAVREDELPSQALGKLAELGDLPALEEALSRGDADVNWRRPKDGNAALHLAAEWGHLEVVQLLLDSRADPELHNNYSMSPFALAAHGSDVENLLAKVTRPLAEDRRYAMKL